MQKKVPYKLASIDAKDSRTVIEIDGVKIGTDEIILMAGPCAIESEEQLLTIANELKKQGVSIIRGSAYKPRTSPYSFQGLGDEALEIHKRAKEKHGLLIETEVMDPRDVEKVAKYVDILRIGSRNMQNYDLLKEVGKCKKPVILKRGLSATVEEWLLAAEYILAHGNPNVILCERGIRTFEPSSRNTLDLGSVAVVKRLTHLPVIVDPSHAAGTKEVISDLSLAAVAGGADGLLIEVHHKPEDALCDKDQALTPHEFELLAKDARLVAKAVRRWIRMPEKLSISLESQREELDLLTEEILSLWAERLSIVKEVGKIKIQENLPLEDEKREDDQIRLIRNIAKEKSLDPTLMEEIFTSFVEYGKRLILEESTCKK